MNMGFVRRRSVVRQFDIPLALQFRIVRSGLTESGQSLSNAAEWSSLTQSDLFLLLRQKRLSGFSSLPLQNQKLTFLTVCQIGCVTVERNRHTNPK
jgi:hypothetical protein